MQAQQVSISLHDESGGYEITPDRVPMAVLKTFTQDVDVFLRGEGSELDTSELQVSVFKGSLGVLTAPIGQTALLQDLRHLSSTDLLDGIDAKRREVVERWQRLAKGTRKAIFKISAPFLAAPITISAQTDFRADDADQWVKVERYLQGEVQQIGGATKVNAHIRLPDNTLLPVESEREVFRNDKVNRLYKLSMVRITAEYNVVTRKYRNARLLSFEEHQDALDESQLQRLIDRGTKAWKDTPKASEWVEALRGGGDA
jgi:hypothetical protein